MYSERYRVRPFYDADYEALSRLMSMANPETPMTAEEVREWDRALAAPHLLDERWIVEERSSHDAVGFGEINHHPFMYHPQKFWVYAIVDPAHRRRGIGRSLGSLIESEAAAHHATVLWLTVRKDDTRSVEIVQKRGFAELRRSWMSTLDLSEKIPPGPSDRAVVLEQEGIRFTTLAEEGAERTEVRRRLFELIDAASRDMPRVGDYTPISFDQFVRQLEVPVMFPEGYFIASHGDEYVSMTNLERDLIQPDSFRVGFTGTRTAYRGRGIATELKRRALEYAQAHRIRYLRTFNDSLNQPMWAINEKQGFRRTVEWIVMERHVSS